MSVILSVMKTATKSAKTKKPTKEKVLPTVFTVRDMNRNTAQVLAACRQHGRVIVKHRAGESFQMTPVTEQAPSATLLETNERVLMAKERMEKHWQKMRDLGVSGPSTPEGIEHVNKIIAGEI
jgi:hypothetical protein